MKYFAFIPALLVVATITGCGSSSSEETTPPATTTTPATNTSATAPGTIVNGQPTQNIAVQPSATAPAAAPIVPQGTVPAVAGKAGLNPEHGQPGHRCDIAVGAPLDSKPSQPAVNTNQQPAIVQQPQQVNIPANNKPVTIQKNPIVINPGNAGAAGLNPEHGKPGHRCDIAVGAPLNSQPTAAATPAINTNPQPVVKQTPATLTTPPAVPVATGAGLNPEHGKPGHRCDIAVGAPLNSKPTQ